jgi:hypothetical protein
MGCLYLAVPVSSHATHTAAATSDSGIIQQIPRRVESGQSPRSPGEELAKTASREHVKKLHDDADIHDSSHGLVPVPFNESGHHCGGLPGIYICVSMTPLNSTHLHIAVCNGITYQGCASNCSADLRYTHNPDTRSLKIERGGWCFEPGTGLFPDSIYYEDRNRIESGLWILGPDTCTSDWWETYCGLSDSPP